MWLGLGIQGLGIQGLSVELPNHYLAILVPIRSPGIRELIDGILGTDNGRHSVSQTEYIIQSSNPSLPR